MPQDRSALTVLATAGLRPPCWGSDPTPRGLLWKPGGRLGILVAGAAAGTKPACGMASDSRTSPGYAGQESEIRVRQAGLAPSELWERIFWPPACHVVSSPQHFLCVSVSKPASSHKDARRDLGPTQIQHSLSLSDHICFQIRSHSQLWWTPILGEHSSARYGCSFPRSRTKGAFLPFPSSLQPTAQFPSESTSQPLSGQLQYASGQRLHVFPC